MGGVLVLVLRASVPLPQLRTVDVGSTSTCATRRTVRRGCDGWWPAARPGTRGTCARLSGTVQGALAGSCPVLPAATGDRDARSSVKSGSGECRCDVPTCRIIKTWQPRAVAPPFLAAPRPRGGPVPVTPGPWRAEGGAVNLAAGGQRRKDLSHVRWYQLFARYSRRSPATQTTTAEAAGHNRAPQVSTTCHPCTSGAVAVRSCRTQQRRAQAPVGCRSEQSGAGATSLGWIQLAAQCLQPSYPTQPLPALRHVGVNPSHPPSCAGANYVAGCSGRRRWHPSHRPQRSTSSR